MRTPIKYLSAVIILFSIQSVLASPFGGVQINLCMESTNGTPSSIACAGLEVSEDGCPEAYTVDGKYCIADDLNAKHQVLIRNTCPVGFEMLGSRCTRPDAPEEDR